MSDIVERLRGPHEWGYRDPAEGMFIRDDSPFDAADEIAALRQERERLRKELSETALTALSIDSRAMDLSERLAEAVEVMRSCRAAYVENDDASALDIIVSALERYINKYEGRS